MPRGFLVLVPLNKFEAAKLMGKNGIPFVFKAEFRVAWSPSRYVTLGMVPAAYYEDALELLSEEI